MPSNGKIFEADAYAFRVQSRCALTGSGIGTGVGGNHSGTLDAQFTPNVVELLSGIQLTVVSSTVGSGSWSATYRGPSEPTGGFTVSGSGFRPVIELECRLLDFKLYAAGPTWRIESSGVEIYLDGALQITLDPFTATLSAFGPSWVPVIGVPPIISGSRFAERTGLPALPEVFSYSARANQTIVGGFRFLKGGEWVDAPITFRTPYEAGGSCKVETTYPGVSGFTSWRATVQGEYKFERSRAIHTTRQILGCRTRTWCNGVLIQDDTAIYDPPVPQKIYRDRADTTQRGGDIRPIPNWSRAFINLSGDTRLLVFRGEMPETRETATKSCYDCDWGVSPDPIIPDVDTRTVHPNLSEFLGNAATGSHPVFDGTTGQVWSESGLAAERIREDIYSTEGVIIPGCPPNADCPDLGDEQEVENTIIYSEEVPEDCSDAVFKSYAFPTYVGGGDPVSFPGGEIFPAMFHERMIPRYINSWANPFWCYALYTENWEVDSANEPWSDYWGLIGSQWAGNMALPGAERTGKRNHLVTNPTERSGFTPFLDAFYGGLRFLGVSRWQTYIPNWPSQFTYTDTQENLISSDDATLAFGADMTVTAATTNPAEIEIELLQSLEIPYLLPALADHIKLDWTATNVTAVKLFMEGVDGSRVEVPITKDVKTRIPRGEAAEYAGSWGSDRTVGGVLDQGVDLEASGRSATSMASGDEATAFGLLPGMTYKKIIIEVEITDTNDPVNIGYPILYFDVRQFQVRPENAFQAGLVRADASGVRFGSLDYYSLGLLDPPALQQPVFGGTVIDALGWARHVFEGDDLLPWLTTLLPTLYDTFENPAVGAVDGESSAFLWVQTGEPKLCLVNTYSECPPLGLFPFRARDAAGEATEGYSQTVYEWAPDRSLFVNAVSNIEVYDDSAVQQSVNLAGLPDGWRGCSISPSLANTEVDWTIRVAGDSTDWAEFRPFRGAVSVLPPEPQVEGAGVAYATHRDLRHAVGWIHNVDGDVQIRHSGNDLTWETEDTGILATALDIAWHKRKEVLSLVLVVLDDGDVKLYASDAHAGNWSSALTLGTGDGGVTVASAGHNVLYTYWVSGTSIMGRRVTYDDTALGAAFTAISGLSAPTAVSADVSIFEEGRFRIILVINDDGDIVLYQSSDGINFSPV